MSNNNFKTFVELHLIQNFSPSNLNRDDTGSPKDCEFGGHRRARISSQSLKRAIRNHPRFASLTGVDNGTRSKWLNRQIIKALVDSKRVQPDDVQAAQAVTTEFLKQYDKKIDTKSGQTSVLIFFIKSEKDNIVNTFVDNWENIVAGNKDGKTVLEKLAKSIAQSKANAPDIALFGRMLAGKVEFNTDAACQVSHAISTHRVTMEMDYYTAVDELLQDEEAGAGMVGFTSFNSACFYRYCRIDWQQLCRNLGWRDESEGKTADEKQAIRQLNVEATDVAQRTITAFLRSAIDAIPTGKQNAFAAQNPTNFALAVVRRDGMCWNLANAFESPVQPKGGNGYVGESIARLDALWGALAGFYDDSEISVLSAYSTEIAPNQLPHLGTAIQPSVSKWLEPVTKAFGGK
jgi:CRISPR system Cascade subunit CasC